MFTRTLPMFVSAILLSGAGCSKAIRLPDDPQAVVMALGYAIGEIPELPPWHVQVHADGKVRVHDLKTGQTIEGKMPRQELETLLRFAVHDSDFFACSADAIQQEQADIHQREGEPRVLVADAATTRLLIRANGQRHQIDFNALDVMAKEYPEIEALSRLVQIEDRLRNLAQQIIERAKPI